MRELHQDGNPVRIPMMPKGVEHAEAAKTTSDPFRGENSDDAERR